MPDASQIAAAINLRVRQLEAQGITGIALVNQMIGHMGACKASIILPPTARFAICANASQDSSATAG